MANDLRFDHAVHFVTRPEDIPEELARLGIHAVQGGRHESIGTYNALTYFDLSYIEWFGVFDPLLLPPHKGTPRYGLIETLAADGYTEGLSRVLLRTRQIEEVAAHLAAQGLDIVGPIDMSRRRPDGKLISWRLVFAGSPDGETPLPMFIQWDDSDEDRRAELDRHGTIAAHERGPLKLDYVAFAVRNLAKTAADWSRLLGLEASAPSYNEHWQGNSQTIRVGDVSLLLIQPEQGGQAWDVLQQRGERPFAIGLTGSGDGGEEYVPFHGSVYHLA